MADLRFRTISLVAWRQPCLHIQSFVVPGALVVRHRPRSVLVELIYLLTGKRSQVPERDGSKSSLKPAWFDYADSEEFMERVRAGMPPLIICVACNGGIQGKEANEVIPETADEIAESVGAAYDAGAAMVHIHARDPEDLTRGARNADPWREVLRKVRQRCPEMIINATTGGGPNMTMEERASSVEAGPEVASLNLAPDMSRFRLKERLAPLSNPRPALDIDECISFTYGQIQKFAE